MNELLSDELLSNAYIEQVAEDEWVSAVLGDPEDVLDAVIWGDSM